MFAPITHSFARMQENIKKLLTSSVPAVSCCNLAKLYWVEEKIVYGKQRVKLNWWLACFYKEPSKDCNNVSTCFKMKPLNTLKRQGQQNVCYQYKWNAFMIFFFCDVEILDSTYLFFLSLADTVWIFFKLYNVVHFAVPEWYSTGMWMNEEGERK